MKKLYPLLFLTYLILCFESCKQSQQFELKGEITGLKSDTILVIYDDPIAKLDTIYLEEGKFIYTFAPDTITLFRLADHTGNTIPLFADRGWKVTLKGTFQAPEIKGDAANQEYQDFRNSIASIGEDSAAVTRQAENFIRSHPQSFVSAYLIDRYFAQVPEPDIEKIDQLIKPLNGNIKDTRIISEIQKSIPQKLMKVTYVNYYSSKDREGKYISWNNIGQAYTLINFWASWDQASKTVRDSLFQLKNEFSKEQLRILNISLDYDKASWLSACKADNEQWTELCDYKGWNNQLVTQNSIRKLPANILINRGRKIIGTNLYGQALGDTIRQLIKTENKK